MVEEGVSESLAGRRGGEKGGKGEGEGREGEGGRGREGERRMDNV